MLKKFISVSLCLLVLLPLFAFAEQRNEEYYTAGFDDDELPDGTDVTFGEDGYIYAENKELVFEASDTYPPVSTVLFPYRVGLEEYVYECDVRIGDFLSDSCFLSLCFGAENDELLYEFSLKCRADDSDGAALRYKNGASSRKTLSCASLPSVDGAEGIASEKLDGGRIKPGAEFHLSVAVKDSSAFCFIDGVQVIEGRLRTSGGGYVGLDGRGVVFSADNVSVNGDIPSAVSASDAFASELYSIKTGVVEPPLTVQRDKTSLPPLSADSARAGAVMITVRESGGALHGYDGAVDSGELTSRLERFSGLALPAFYVSDTPTAKLLSEFLKENSINDAFVVVSRNAFIPEFRDNKYIRLVLDMSSRDSVGLSDVYDAVYSSGVRTVMLSESAADAETVYGLHKLLISVWVSGSADIPSLFDAAVNGADAIVTSESASFISALEDTEEKTVLRRPVIISDGGDGAAAPTNSLKSVLAAFSSGASAVKVDLQLTRDGVPVIYDGDYTAGMSGDLVISESNFTALRTLTYRDSRMDQTERITSLEELFEAVCRDRPEAVLHINIENVQAVEKTAALAAEYDMRRRIVILSGTPDVLRAASALGSAAAYTGGPYVWDGRDDAQAISALCRGLLSYNSAFYGDFPGMPEELVKLAHQRGLTVIAAGFEGAEAGAASPYDGMCVNSSSRLAKLPSGLTAVCDGDGRLTAKIRYYDGTELDVTALCGIIPFSGGVRLSGGTVSGDGVFAVVCPQTSDGGEKYRLCSATLKISERGADAETERLPSVSDDNTLTVIIISAASAAAAGGIIVFGVLAHKKRKKAV